MRVVYRAGPRPTMHYPGSGLILESVLPTGYAKKTGLPKKKEDIKDG
jgi:hypothetical protein